MPIRIAKHKQTKKIKKDRMDTFGVKFVEGVVDDCAINGDMILMEYTFPCGISTWNPKIIDNTGFING